jgi:DNA-binding NtrC family response regulator
LVARLVHESSRRANGPFVAVNCGAIPRELIGSELFGHEKGAFTVATESRDGYFVEAHGGTLFLDEIGELPLELQPHLLRVLETRKVRRIGGAHERSVDVRIVAATNRTEGLGTEASGYLRLDLYHRVATMVLSLPPLRERSGDIIDIVQAMLDDGVDEFGRKSVTNEAWLALTTYTWPGNIRELKHAVSRAVALGGPELGPLDFFPDFVRHFGYEPPSEANERGAVDELDGLQPYESMICGAMEQALAQHGTIRAAAQALGMPKSTFADKAQRWGIVGKRRRRAG